jgi:hypothetical protein
VCSRIIVKIFVCLFVCLVVFNPTFNNSSAISWRSVLLMEETGGPGENHRGKDQVCVWSSLIDKFRVVWKQGDIYNKPKTRFKNCNIWNWILWVVVFRLQFCFIGDGGLSQFFFIGDGGLSQFFIMLYTLPYSRFELTTAVVIGTDCIGSCKSNYHAITVTTAIYCNKSFNLNVPFNCDSY